MLQKPMRFAFALLAALLFSIGVFAAESVIYENDFSDPQTLLDFTEYRHGWEIRDGALYATAQKLDGGVNDAYSHILLNVEPSLTDYIAEVDYLNVQAQGGLVFNADASLATNGKNAFCGYFAFGASTADKGAFGHANAEGGWAGNINVGAVAFAKGDDLRIRVTVKGDYVDIRITNIKTGAVVYAYTYTIGANPAHTAWRGGTVGLRLSGTAGCFDNLRVTTANEIAVPSVVPVTDFGEGMTFGENSGRYMFEHPLAAMPLTFEATVYFPYAMTSDYTHIFMSNFQRSKTGFLFEVTKGGQPSLMFYDENDVRTRYTFSGVRLYNGKKTHLAIAADPAAGRIGCYIDGELMQTLELTVDPADFSTEHMMFGTDNREVNLNLFRGALIDLTCYADTRTADEIKEDMTAPSSDGLLLRFDLHDAKYGEDAVDLSPYRNRAVYERFWIDEAAPVGDYAFSVAVVGDTQHNVQYQPANFAKLYDFLRANAKSEKIAFMLGLGDITNDNTDEQWSCAIENFAKLDGVIPYALAKGNHDGSAASYSSKFDGTAYAAAIGGNYFKNRANSYQKFKAGNVNYLVITLNYNPAADELAFAKSVADQNPYHRVIVITHSYLAADGSYTAHGKNIWNGFVRLCPNVEAVLSGHVLNDKILRTSHNGDAGNTVSEFMINGQGVDCTRIYAGQDAAGLVAMFCFDADGKRLSVRYFSTVLDKYFMDCNSFETTVGHPVGDVDFNGRVTLGDALHIARSVISGKVCYGGDVSGDTELTLADVLAAIRRIL